MVAELPALARVSSSAHAFVKQSRDHSQTLRRSQHLPARQDAGPAGLAALGMLNPFLTAFIHVSSELAFILNSARLLPAKSKKARRAASPLAAFTVGSAA